MCCLCASQISWLSAPLCHTLMFYVWGKRLMQCVVSSNLNCCSPEMHCVYVCVSECGSVKKVTAAESPWWLAQRPWRDYVIKIEAVRNIPLSSFSMWNHTTGCYQLRVATYFNKELTKVGKQVLDCDLNSLYWQAHYFQSTSVSVLMDSQTHFSCLGPETLTQLGQSFILTVYWPWRKTSSVHWKMQEVFLLVISPHSWNWCTLALV